jgi:hypothetical protein
VFLQQLFKATNFNMNVDLEHVPGQMGTAVVDLISGSIIQSSGDLSGEDGRLQCEKLYQMMKVCFIRINVLIISANSDCKIGRDEMCGK